MHLLAAQIADLLTISMLRSAVLLISYALMAEMSPFPIGLSFLGT